MDLFEAIRTRRSIRRYDRSRDVEPEKLQACLEAARWAPSASNKQPWHFVVVRDRMTREKLAGIHPFGKFMSDSPVVVVVLGDPQRHATFYKYDPSAATQNFLLAAHAQGLGTCWMGVVGSPFEPEIKKLIGVPENLCIVCTISVGYSLEKPEKARFPLEEMVSYERFGKKSKT